MKLVFNRAIPEAVKKDWDEDVTLVVPEDKFTEEEVLAHIEGADALVTVSTPISPEFLDKAREASGGSLRVLATVSVGYDHIPVAHAHELGMMVINTPESVRYPTAELTIGMALDVLRGIRVRDAAFRKDLRFPKRDFFDGIGIDVLGKTVGVLGMGSIGSKVAEVFHVLGAHIIYTQRHEATPDVLQRTGAERVTIEELFERSDILTLHVPYVPEFHNVINEESIATMKDGVYIINAARGPLIDEIALIAALKSGKVAGAALDVFEHEPFLNEELAALENVIVVPHMGTTTVEARAAMGREAVDGTIRALRGEEPRNLVK